MVAQMGNQESKRLRERDLLNALVLQREILIIVGVSEKNCLQCKEEIYYEKTYSTKNVPKRLSERSNLKFKNFQ